MSPDTPTPEPLGYVVAIREYDAWNATWDGEIHATKDLAEEQMRFAQAAGYEAVTTALVPFPINTEGDDRA